MATSLLSTNNDILDQNIYDVINNLKKKHKQANVESIHKEDIKITSCIRYCGGKFWSVF